VLLRQINAGLIHHSIGILGLPQQVVAMDGNLFPYSYQAVAETIATGETLDTLVAVPATTVPGTLFPVFEQGWRIHNAGQRLAPGGRLPLAAFSPL
jgi:FtsP/CotA-like multicopper oxidase with cupredoxin domain